ncbi:MAG: ABC transporter permease [Planctomycetaceae bacterium]|nr:ABC transporter permease [Planctomycetaceae bacterium]
MSGSSPSTVQAAWALAKRELIRFLGQRTRVVGAIGQPVIFWILFGAGLRSSFRTPSWAESLNRSLSYQEYFFPGIAVLIVMFTAIFSTISIIEDRREGFLQGVLVAPVSRSSIVLGKLIGGTLLSLLQAGLFIAVGPLLSLVGLAPEFDPDWSFIRILMATGFLALIAFELTAIGFLIAWPMNSSQGFHAVMSIFLMPMWLVSGAFFPGADAGWLTWLIRLNPLTYGVAGLRRILYAVPLPATPELPSMPACLTMTAITVSITTAFAVWLVSRPSSHNAV